jgi:hypothetical protein
MKVCLVGTAPGSRLIAPYKDESYEIWACSAGNSQSQALPRVTKWFELHALCDMMAAENVGWCAPYFGWLRAQTFPVYMQERNDYVPGAIVFPYKGLIEEFGPNPKKHLANWFTSTVAWMMAFAIVQMREGDEIAIFGVDMAATEEHYSSQKAGCLRFIEIAQQKGIKVTIPYESCLGKTFPLYGYAEATPHGRKMAVREYEIKNHKLGLDGQIRSLELQRAFFEGALEGVHYEQRTWLDGADAELDEGEIAGDAKAMVESLKGYVPAPWTGNYTENSQGLFVPHGMGAAPPTPGSTVKIDPVTGAKHYGMECEPGKFFGEGGSVGAPAEPPSVPDDTAAAMQASADKQRAKRKRPNGRASAEG